MAKKIEGGKFLEKVVLHNHSSEIMGSWKLFALFRKLFYQA